MEWIKHRTNIARLKIESQNKSNDGVRIAIEEVRAEIRTLRDTTMQYDLSFDAALQRMERRVEGLERRALGGEVSDTLDLRGGR